MCPATKLLLADVYTASIWEFAQDMYYKQPKNDEYGYHLGTVKVIPNHSQVLESFAAGGGAGKLATDAAHFVNELSGLGV